MAGYQGPTNYPDWTPLDHPLQRRYERSASLQVGVSNTTGKISIVVWYNDEGRDENGKPLRAKIQMSPFTFARIMSIMRGMADGRISKERVYVNLKNRYSGQQRLDQPRTEASVVISKKNGIIAITPIEGNKPALTFKMLPDDLVEFTDADKTPLDLAESSAIETHAWCDTLQRMVDIIVATKTEEKKKQGRPNDNSGSGYNKQKGNQHVRSDYDDEDPY